MFPDSALAVSMTKNLSDLSKLNPMSATAQHFKLVVSIHATLYAHNIFFLFLVCELKRFMLVLNASKLCLKIKPHTTQNECYASMFQTSCLQTCNITLIPTTYFMQVNLNTLC